MEPGLEDSMVKVRAREEAILAGWVACEDGFPMQVPVSFAAQGAEWVSGWRGASDRMRQREAERDAELQEALRGSSRERDAAREIPGVKSRGRFSAVPVATG